MARRSSIRQQSALKSVDYIESQYAVRNEMNRKDIRQRSFQRREKSIDDMFGFATQALGVLDKYQQKKAEDVKIEKSVTAMAGKTGGDVSYKKPKISDWIKGEAKFSQIGKESWSIGGEDFTRADMLAYDKFQMKNKWEGKIGENMKTDSSYATDGKGNVVEKETPGIKTAEPEAKEYQLVGSNKDIEDKYGAGWSYDKQKAINKNQVAVERGEKRLERFQERQQRGAERTARREQRKADWKEKYDAQVERVSNHPLGYKAHQSRRKAKSYDQVVGLAGEPGDSFDRLMVEYEKEFGSNKQTKELKQDRLDFIKENPYMNEAIDDEPKPSKLDDLVGKISNWHKKGKANIFKNLTKETNASSEAGAVLNADTTFSETDSAYAPADYGEDAQVSLDPEEISALNRSTGVPNPKEYKEGPDWDRIEKDRLANVEAEKGRYAAIKSQYDWMKDKSGQVAEKPKLASGGIQRTLDYLEGDMAFDDTISTEGLTFAPSSIDKRAGTASFSLYGKKGEQLYENAMTVRLGDQGQATRDLVNIAPTFKKWSGIGDLTSDIEGFDMKKLNRQMLALGD